MLGDEWDSRWRRIADRLRENADDTLEISDRAQTAVPPRRVARPRAHREARLVLLEQTLMDRGAHVIETDDDHRIEVVVERITERRREHHGSRWTSLV